MKNKIYIVDDFQAVGSADYKIAQGWRDAIDRHVGSDYDVELLPMDRARAGLLQLEKRREAHRKDKPCPDEGEDVERPFDDAAMLIVDYDLLYLDDDKSATGEDVAYLARCFSNCGLIVGVNRFRGASGFDLRMSPPLDSYADYNFDGRWLTDRGTWFADTVGDTAFRPWPWPALTNEITAFNLRVAQVKEQLEKQPPQPSILDFFGFPEREKRNLPRNLCVFLETATTAYTETTFADFVAHSPYALRQKDAGHALSTDAASRIAACRIQAWLERAVAPRLDILVDAPHLAYEYPSLVEATEDLDSWNLTTDLYEPRIRNENIARHEFGCVGWLSRKNWWRNIIANDRNIKEVIDPWDSTRPEFLFAEDLSRFVHAENARPFVADTGSSTNVRYITAEGYPALRNLDISYSPLIRLAI